MNSSKKGRRFVTVQRRFEKFVSYFVYFTKCPYPCGWPGLVALFERKPPKQGDCASKRFSAPPELSGKYGPTWAVTKSLGRNWSFGRYINTEGLVGHQKGEAYFEQPVSSRRRVDLMGIIMKRKGKLRAVGLHSLEDVIHEKERANELIVSDAPGNLNSQPILNASSGTACDSKSLLIEPVNPRIEGQGDLTPGLEESR